MAPSSDSRSYQLAASLPSLSVEVSTSRSASRCFDSSLALITWPPPKPISTRFISSGIVSSSASPIALDRLDQLGERPAGRLGMQEGDAAAPDANAGLGVDQLDAGLAQLRQGRVDVLDPVGDVMDALAAAGDEPAHRGVRTQGAKQLDVPVSNLQQDRL